LLTRFSADDAERVLGWVTSAAEARRWAGLTKWPPPAGILQAWHAEPDVHPFTLTLGGSDGPIGYGEVWLDAEEDEAELARLLIAPTVRGHGYGRQLVELLTDEARRKGFFAVWLRVMPENAQAIACYRSAGFVRATESEEAVFNVGQPCQYTWMRPENALPRQPVPNPQGTPTPV
jgi:ribosomal protein S18 acetylase RimI-like enzyme